MCMNEGPAYLSIRGSGVCACVFINLTTYKLTLMKLIGN